MTTFSGGQKGVIYRTFLGISITKTFLGGFTYDKAYSGSCRHRKN